MGAHCRALQLVFLGTLVVLPQLLLASTTRYYTFNVRMSICSAPGIHDNKCIFIVTSSRLVFDLQVTMKKVTRLCTTRAIPTVNGKFPGPKIVTREGDRVVVKVVNNVKQNVSIHW